MSQVINVYTSTASSSKARSLAYQLFFNLLPGTRINILPLSELQQAPKGQQQQKATRGHLLQLKNVKQDALAETEQFIGLAERDAHLYQQTLADLRANRDRLTIELLDIERQLSLGQEGGREL